MIDLGMKLETVNNMCFKNPYAIADSAVALFAKYAVYKMKVN